MKELINSVIFLSIKRYVIVLVITLAVLFSVTATIIKSEKALFIFIISAIFDLLTTLILRTKEKKLTFLNLISDTIFPFSCMFTVFLCVISFSTLQAELCFITATILIVAYHTYWNQEEKSVKSTLLVMKNILSYVPFLPFILIG